MSDVFVSPNLPKDSNHYFLSPAPKVEAAEPEALTKAPNKQNDEFAILAERIKNNPYAIVITRATDNDKNLGLNLDLRSSWNHVALFLKKIISWIKDSASNRIIKESFIKYINEKISNSEDPKADDIRKSLARIVNPSSGWPLDLRVVKKFVDETNSLPAMQEQTSGPQMQDIDKVERANPLPAMTPAPQMQDADKVERTNPLPAMTPAPQMQDADKVERANPLPAMTPAPQVQDADKVEKAASPLVRNLNADFYETHEKTQKNNSPKNALSEKTFHDKGVVTTRQQQEYVEGLQRTKNKTQKRRINIGSPD